MIPYKDKESEFEIQSYVYENIKNKGYNIRGCVPTERGFKPKLIFDLVIFNKKNRPIEIIEIKDSPKHSVETIQSKKYWSLGYPVVYIRGMEEAIKYCLNKKAS